MQDLSQLLQTVTAVGFSGSRTLENSSIEAFYSIYRMIQQNYPSLKVITGCASGLDFLCRKAFGGAEASSLDYLKSVVKDDGIVNFGNLSVFVADSKAFGPISRSAFARRSTACVREVAKQDGLWLSFPSVPCPNGLVPSSISSKAFSGKGSGTWASAALAIGMNVKFAMFLPDDDFVPKGKAWDDLCPLSESLGWWTLRKKPVQLSLF